MRSNNSKAIEDSRLHPMHFPFSPCKTAGLSVTQYRLNNLSKVRCWKDTISRQCHVNCDVVMHCLLPRPNSVLNLFTNASASAPSCENMMSSTTLKVYCHSRTKAWPQVIFNEEKFGKIWTHGFGYVSGQTYIHTVMVIAILCNQAGAN